MTENDGAPGPWTIGVLSTLRSGCSKNDQKRMLTWFSLLCTCPVGASRKLQDRSISPSYLSYPRYVGRNEKERNSEVMGNKCLSRGAEGKILEGREVNVGGKVFKE